MAWSSQRDPAKSYQARKKGVLAADPLLHHFSSVYWALTVPAREEGDLTGDPLLPCCSSFSQTFTFGVQQSQKACLMRLAEPQDSRACTCGDWTATAAVFVVSAIV